MQRLRNTSRRILGRLKIILTAWPWPGALFILASFIFTAFELSEAFSGREVYGWVDPLASILAGLGAFILAAILIARRVDSARAQTESYGLARGLATGYYFNFIRPLVLAVRDSQHPIHADATKLGKFRIVGLVIGIPSSIAELDPAQHEKLLKSLTDGSDAKFKLQELPVTVTGRPRPVFTKIVLNEETGCAALVDIPTTLSVIADFAEFFTTHGSDDGASDDDYVNEARKEIVATAETADFSARLQQTLEEFRDVVSKVGSMEESKISVASLVHIVPANRLKHRLDEITGK